MDHEVTEIANHEPSTQPTTALPFLHSLEVEALGHKAVQHPYLLALSEGTLRDPRCAVQDFAREYQGYSAWFPRFLSALEARLPSDLRSILEENKEEEGGRYDEETLLEIEAAGLRREWVDGVPSFVGIDKLIVSCQDTLTTKAGLSRGLRAAHVRCHVRVSWLRAPCRCTR